ncbi:hypothetical protein HII31_02626 [Pseudocercospora fuligena]|uniref:F-box domain-containing protein n=1 Tax=Pseudocercospora fuligena TaxID=685502 RepID=A0A8H6VLD3_9PEZI|nr:hypothetical protein HII31_02626 [Pseudocercospora fuligena]
MARTKQRSKNERARRRGRLEKVREAIIAGILPADTARTKLSKHQSKRLEILRTIVAATTPATEADDDDDTRARLKLLDLPAELIKRILSLACATDEQTVVVSSMHGRAAAKVEDFLVSKAYFAVAAAAYVGDRVFQINDHSAFSGIINAYATKIVITDSVFLERWMKDSFPKVKQIEMQLSNWCLQGWYTIEWRHEQTKRQMELNWLSKKCREVLGGLDSFKANSRRVEAATGPSPARDQMIKICRENAKLFETVVSKVALRPRSYTIGNDSGGVASERSPIYPGSNVILGPSVGGT